MRLEVTIGCAACGFSDRIHVDSYFNCDDLICPNCRNENCLSITSATEETVPAFRRHNILQQLRRIRQL